MSLLRRAMERVRPRFDREPIGNIMPIMPPAPRRPMPLPMVPPQGLPLQPPSQIFSKDPNAPSRQISRDSQGNMILGDIIEPIKPPPLIQQLRPPVNIGRQGSVAGPPERPPVAGGTALRKRQDIQRIPIPLEDFGFGPGIRPTEMIGPDGQFIGSAGVTPPGGVRDPFVPPPQPPRVPLSERTDIFGAGKRFDPVNLPEGFSFDRPNEGTFTSVMPRPGFVYAYGPDGQRVEVPSGDTSGIAPVMNPIIEPTSATPAAQTTNMQPMNVSNQDPFAASVTQQQVGLDPLTEQLLFGLGGKGGFIPGAMRAAEKVFYDDQGNPIVIDEQVAGFSPDQLQAMQMQRDALGIQNPFLMGAGEAFGSGTQALEEGLQRGRTAALGSLAATTGGVGSLQSGLGESADILRSTLGGYDPSMTQQFYDPFEDRVVQQTIEDIMEQGAKSDIGARASDIARGGESAFGSRARLGASERQEALGRGLAEALGGIRSRGFQQAQQTGLGEFARQKAAERAASSGLASLAGQGFGGSQALAGALSGLGQTEQDIGQQRYSGQFGLGTSLQGLGAQAAGASASDIASLYGMGAQQQGQTQQMLDAQRRNLQQRQMTPLLQYQALQPFVSMAPAGQFQTTTQFAPPPSPMQAGLGVGLSAFGALGQLYGGGK